VDTLPLRLHPGADLRRELEAQTEALGGSAFVVCGIGSLQGVRIRLAAEAHEMQREGPFEIVSLSGTLSKDGAHLHMAVADSHGQVLGGHVCYGNTVRTTAEVPVAKLVDWELDRDLDEGTGFNELVIRSRT
jgi:predicted DNA-binding protein with PD1-like motif